jgi:hypothetical protein
MGFNQQKILNYWYLMGFNPQEMVAYFCEDILGYSWPNKYHEGMFSTM